MNDISSRIQMNEINMIPEVSAEFLRELTAVVQVISDLFICGFLKYWTDGYT